MATIITSHGFQFSVESDGWSGHDDDRDRAIESLQELLDGHDSHTIAALHRNVDRNSHTYEVLAVNFCAMAVWQVVRDWPNPNKPSLFLSAA